MDSLDLFFKKFSYKFPKGYPDMKNEHDILLLESLVNKILGEEIVLEKKLEWKDLSDDDNGPFVSLDATEDPRFCNLLCFVRSPDNQLVVRPSL
jgi:hypothetical protein